MSLGWAIVVIVGLVVVGGLVTALLGSRPASGREKTQPRSGFGGGVHEDT